MLLTGCYVALRFVHFAALMLLLGCTVWHVLLAPARLSQLLAQRLRPLWQSAAAGSLIAALLMLVCQAGLMGDGWEDTLKPGLWLAVLETHFGAVWLGQLVLAVATLALVFISARKIQGYLLLFTLAQLILLADTGHATLHDGLVGVIQRVSQAIHLTAAGFWVGGLAPAILCLHLTRKSAWRAAAIRGMMNFSGYGHLAVAAVIITGIINSLLIASWPPPLESFWFRLLLLKIILVGVMVTLALANRYWLVPRFNRSARAQSCFILFTGLEMVLSAAALVLVSLLALQQPF